MRIEDKRLEDAKEWLTIKEAAKLHGRAASNLYRWIKNKTLPFRYADDGRTIEVHRDAVTKADDTNFANSKTRRKAA